MMKRLLIAVPVAACLVIGVYLAMAGVLFPVPGQPKRGVCFCLGHGSEKKDASRLERPVERDAEAYRRLPPPPRVLPSIPKERVKIPHKRFPPPQPEPTKPELGPQAVTDHCEPFRHGPLYFPKGARNGDQVTVEYTIQADGTVENVKVISSTNPEVNDEVVSMVQRWRWAPPGGCRGQPEARIRSGRIRTRIELRLPADDSWSISEFVD